MTGSIGETAGHVWRYLKKHSEVNTPQLVREVAWSRDDVQRAIGWLAREDKLNIEKVKRSERIRLK